MLSIPQNCDSCNKSFVCKFKEDISKEKEKIINNMQNTTLPLTIEITCQQYDSRIPSLTIK